MKKQFILSIIFLLFISVAIAQRGKNGAKVISASEVVNAYTRTTANALVGQTSISVVNSALNVPSLGNLAQGDLIMIIQVQGGVSIEDTVGGVFGNSSKFFDTWGSIIDYQHCGKHEFVQVTSVPNATTINIDCPLTYDYSFVEKVIIVRVPRYSSLTINAGGTLTTTPWNGTSGGIVAVEVDGITTINGSIDVSGLGFRGGTALNNSQASAFGAGRYADSNPLEGAEKGESIYGDQTDYSFMNFGGAQYCRGAPANGGGGGDSHNAGGGGGSNAGDLILWNKGVGVPDPTYNVAWALESPSISGTISSGGGRGGYTSLSSNQNPLTTAPGAGPWNGDFRREVGGLGGRPLDYSTGKIFFGGGGGAGEGDNGEAGDGGNGAGLIYLTTYGNITGAGQILANGADGGDDIGTSVFNSLRGRDAGGGAGAGGTIILKSTGTNTLSGGINANGGIGGEQFLVAGTLYGPIDEGEGPGGGGGGGYIAVSTGTPTRTANGGLNGVTNSPYVSSFPPNGATSGGTGLPNESIDAFDISVTNVNICTNTSTSLTATITGTPPAGSSIEWYSAQFGGALLFTGSTFTTPVLAATTTYWVKVCPAPYLVPVTVTVAPCASLTAQFSSTDSILCARDCINFTDLSNGGTPTGWTWSFPGAVISSSTAQNPTSICYNSPGTFDVQLIVTDGVTIDTLLMPNFITVFALPTITTSIDTSICIGDTAFISATGGITYSWDNGLGAGQNQNPTPVGNTTYIVTGTDINGCQNTDAVNVIVNSLPSVIASNDTSICIGDTAFISATGGTTYNWDNGLGAGQNQNPTPIVNTTYIVIGTDVNACSNTDQVIVTVNSLPTVIASVDTSICIGDTAFISAIGATTYNWDNSLGVGQNQTPTPITNTTYIVTGTDVNGCSNTDQVIVTLNLLPTIVASNDTTICSGDPVNLSATGAPSYNWDNGLGAGQNQTPSPLANTTYIVTGTDVNGCINTDQVVVTVSICGVPPVVSFSSTDSILCLGDCINFTDLSTNVPTGWTWYFFGSSVPTSGIQNPTNICYNTAGSFDVALVATNAFGQDSLFMPNFITVNPLPNVTANASVNPICVGDPITLTGGGATTYTWDNSVLDNVAFNPTNTTLYTVTGTDGNGCQETDTITIFVNPLPNVTANASTNPICSGDPVTLTGGGATSYTWDNSVTDNIAFNPTSTTLYTVTGTDGNNCSNTDTVTVFVNPLPNVTAIASANPICSGDPVTLTGGGATSYTWDNSVTDNVAFNPISTTLYTVTGTDGNNCSNTDTVTVFVTVCLNPPLASFSSSDSSLCLGDCINYTDLSSNNPTGWTWYFFGAATTSSNIQNPTNICYTTAGTFDVALVSTNSLGQDSIFMPAFITVNPLPNVTANASSTTICIGDPVTLTGGSATSYTWDNGVTNGIPFNPVNTALYTVTGTDANGCQNTDTITITISSCGLIPVANFSASDSSLCLGDCINFTDLSAGSPTGWTWYFFGADSTISSQQNPSNICYNTAGSFDVALVATNSLGQDSIYLPNFITVNPLPTVTANTNNTTVCAGSPVILTGGGAIAYTWDNGVTDGIAFNPTNTTIYTVIGTDGNGCINTDTVAVIVSPCIAPVAAISSVTNACVNDCIDYTDISANIPTNWTWYFYGGNPLTSTNQNPPNICYDTVGTYNVALVVSNAFGQDSLYMPNYITIDSCNIIPDNIMIPNVFSPNGDGSNELFKVDGTGITNFNLEIYNRWGELLYQSFDVNGGWDGRTSAGKIVPEGTYFYIIGAELSGTQETYKGTLTLIR